ncbi:hypothetical protein GCM10025881_03440 [Pseudolysinimonas kribbensis]|uniref:Aminotransferase class III-fold pyridoxal phosphate-dependent enzyme n=1 Tax=Pseudolysinimonas kribbensis TaxID=433641 RepID=A0ABQ6K362_9MICO|nr:hypothetical protein GCM10025881_03440 [Pseudolysinimonas kribbensis]
MNASTFTTRFRAAMMPTVPSPLAMLSHGKGARVWDVEGTEYLDFLGGIAVNALGHAHPVFTRAVSAQAERLAHISNYFASEPELALAERLTRLTGGDAVYFTNSGTEAIEAAVKLARRTGRPRILSLTGSFHGRTMGALSLTGKPVLQDPFRPLLPGSSRSRRPSRRSRRRWPTTSPPSWSSRSRARPVSSTCRTATSPPREN